MLKDDINDIRKARHKKTQEDFTPVCICKKLCEGSEELFTDFKKTMCDPCCGTGNILRYILEQRLNNCQTKNDIYKALQTLYGVELMSDNVRECRKSILMDIIEFCSKKEWDIKESKILKILKENIVCSDFFKWDFENWRPIVEEKQLTLDFK